MSDIRTMVGSVFLPVVLADIQYLSSVFLDYRKRMCLNVFVVCLKRLFGFCSFSRVEQMGLFLRIYYVVLVVMSGLTIFLTVKISNLSHEMFEIEDLFFH